MVTFDVWSKEANDKSNNKNKRSSKFIRCFNFWKVLVKEIAIIVLLIFLPLISLKNQCNFLFHLEVFVWCVLSFLCHTFWIHLIFYLHLANRRNICEYPCLYLCLDRNWICCHLYALTTKLVDCVSLTFFHLDTTSYQRFSTVCLVI